MDLLLLLIPHTKALLCLHAIVGCRQHILPNRQYPDTCFASSRDTPCDLITHIGLTIKHRIDAYRALDLGAALLFGGVDGDFSTLELDGDRVVLFGSEGDISFYLLHF